VTQQWRKEVEDAMAVMGGLQARQGRVLKDHSEWLQSHDLAMRQHQEAMALLDSRIDKLVSSMGEFIRLVKEAGK
jgi:L-lactate utilization protein LutB